MFARLEERGTDNDSSPSFGFHFIGTNNVFLLLAPGFGCLFLMVQCSNFSTWRNFLIRDKQIARDVKIW